MFLSRKRRLKFYWKRLNEKKILRQQFIFNNKLCRGMTNSNGIRSYFSSLFFLYRLFVFFFSFFRTFFYCPWSFAFKHNVASDSPERFVYVSYFYYFFPLFFLKAMSQLICILSHEERYISYILIKNKLTNNNWLNKYVYLFFFLLILQSTLLINHLKR